MQTQQTDELAAKEYADKQFIKPYEDLKDADKDAWVAIYDGYLKGLEVGRGGKIVVESDEEAFNEAIKGAGGFSIKYSLYRYLFDAGCIHVRQQLSQQQQQRQYGEKGELLEDMALFIEKMQNSKFYAAMTNEGKQLLYELLTRYNQHAPK